MIGAASNTAPSVSRTRAARIVTGFPTWEKGGSLSISSHTTRKSRPLEATAGLARTKVGVLGGRKSPGEVVGAMTLMPSWKVCAEPDEANNDTRSKESRRMIEGWTFTKRDVLSSAPALPNERANSQPKQGQNRRLGDGQDLAA